MPGGQPSRLEEIQRGREDPLCVFFIIQRVGRRGRVGEQGQQPARGRRKITPQVRFFTAEQCGEKLIVVIGILCQKCIEAQPQARPEGRRGGVRLVLQG